MMMNARIRDLFKTPLFYYSLVLLVAMTSFITYSPLFHPYFNSDHGVHVLMSYRFDYPEALFYWGQNRLGSLLPLVTHGFVKWLGIHPLIAISIVNHIFLLTIFFILSIPLKKTGYKLILCLFIFFPLFTYNALLLVGHPYCSQLFAATLAIYFYSLIYKRAMSEDFTFTSFQYWIYGFIATFLVVVSIWVSELSYLLGVFLIVFVLADFPFLKRIKSIFLKEKTLTSLFIIANIACLDMWFKKLGKYKGYFPKEELYEKAFMDNSLDIYQQKIWMKEKVINGLNFSGNDYMYSIFYWSLIAIFVSSLFFFRQTKMKSPLNLAIAATILTGFILLFYSTWNYRSEYEPRYYTALVVIMVFYLLYLSAEIIHKYFKWIVTGFWIIISFALIKNNSNVILPLKESVADKYKDFAKLPRGGLIGSYWRAYQINAVCPYNIKSIPIQNDAQRNKHMIWEVLDEPVIYIIKNDFLDMNQPMPDTLVQFDLKLIKIDKKEYQISDVTYGKYKKLK